MGQLKNLDWEQTDISALISGIKGNGVATGLAVSESSPAAMSVLVAAGTADVDDTDYVEGSGQNLNISNGHATLLRKDIVVYDTTAGAPAICEGTPASAPHPPDVPADSIYLAMVHVGIAESTSITNSDIDEGRVYVNGKLRGIDTGADVTADNTPQDHASLHLRDGGDAIEYYSPTGSTVLLHDTTEDGTTSTSYVKLVERTITSNAYTLIVTFELKSSYNGSAGAAYAAIYKNGVLFGTEQGNSTTSWSTKSQTLGDWANNDKIQIYAKTAGSGATASIKNMKVLGTMLKFPVQPTWT